MNNIKVHTFKIKYFLYRFSEKFAIKLCEPINKKLYSPIGHALA